MASSVKYRGKRPLSESVKSMGQMNSGFFCETQGKEATFGKCQVNGPNE